MCSKPLVRIKRRIDTHDTEDERLFDAVMEVMDDLRLDAFPRFEVSIYYKAIGIRDFLSLRRCAARSATAASCTR